MNAIVFEHVPIAELPPEWRAKLTEAPGATVTVRIEAEDQDSTKVYADDPLFGCGATARIWPMSPATCAASARIGSATTRRPRTDRRC